MVGSVCFRKIVQNIVIVSFFYASYTRSIDLSIINDSGSTVLITFTRAVDGRPLGKLLEAGEVINFGRVYEASVQSYSTIWGYIAPAKHLFFSTKEIKQPAIDCVTVRLNGVAGRSFLSPFGQWNYEMMIGKVARDIVPQICKLSITDTVLDAFPTAKRKIMYTPRYVLGLPQYAGIDDAIEAAAMLQDKWNTVIVESAEAHKLALNIAQMLEESRKAFEYGKADVPLHIPIEMRCAGEIDPAHDAADLAWS